MSTAESSRSFLDSLADAWREMPAEWRRTIFARPGDFPLLAKFIFRQTNFPSGSSRHAYAAAHEKAAGGHGKTRNVHIASGKA